MQKLYAAAAGALAQLALALADNTVSNKEWVSVGIAALTALHVYEAANTPKGV